MSDTDLPHPLGKKHDDPFVRSLPSDHSLVRSELYSGTIFLLPPSSESLRLVEEASKLLVEELRESFRNAQFESSGEEFFEKIGRLRKRLYTEKSFHDAVEDVILGVGFSPEEQAYDPARLRVVTHGGHENPAAAPIYYGHRDTWYSNPQAMITWWIPLHDVLPKETFEFFPDEYARAVKNDSEKFDFQTWVSEGQEKRIGWQRRDTGLTATYPQLLEQPKGIRLPVTAKAGEVLLFAGQHLHQTRPNLTGRTRFSLDFRTVHLKDHHAGVGAPNVDNRSTGSSIVQFVHASPR